MLPIDPLALLGKTLGYSIYLLVGVGFGAVLEASGFGDSRKLSAQFYFRDMTVLKVMFGAIVVAMVLIFGGSALGLVDFPRLYVNKTYLWPQIVGGLVMGLGFIIGGFCPGTSLVGLSTLKLDGLFFTGGVFAGVWLFGETVDGIDGFYEAGYMGRFTLPEWLKIDAGPVVLAIVLAAVSAFAAAGWAEKRIGRPEVLPAPEKRRRVAALALIAGAAAVWIIGQPDPARRWKQMPAGEEKRLQRREVFVHPAELVELMHNPQLYLHLLDVRSESDYNLFHLDGARRFSLEGIASPRFDAGSLAEPANTVIVVMANQEYPAMEAYRLLRGHGLLNVYILEGGVDNWLRAFPPTPEVAVPGPPAGTDGLSFHFFQSVGDTIPSAAPASEEISIRFGTSFPRRVTLKTRKILKGGCG
jgi:rhodanese-related sulfurtransferase